MLRHGSHSFYLQITLCLPLLRKCSPDSASPDWGCRHLIVCLSILQSLLSVVAVSSSTRSVQHQEGYLACIYCLAVLKGLHRERWDSMGWSQVNLGWPQVNLDRSQVNLPDPRSTCLTPGQPGLIPGQLWLTSGQPGQIPGQLAWPLVNLGWSQVNLVNICYVLFLSYCVD